MATKKPEAEEVVEQSPVLADDGSLNLEALSLEKLRKYCSFYRIPISNTAEKAEVIEAIKGKMKGRDLAQVAEVSDAPLPGWTRIELNRDPVPGASNRPVYVAINGYRITIPRGVPVDVPHKIVQVLADAKDWKLVEDLDAPLNSPKRYVRQPHLSYPFQVLAMTPGPDPRPGYEKSKQAHYGPRKEFHELFGRWPKKQELLDAQKEGFIKLKMY